VARIIISRENVIAPMVTQLLRVLRQTFRQAILVICIHIPNTIFHKDVPQCFEVHRETILL
jgi:hypothetical protein